MTEYTHYSKKRDVLSRFFCLFKTLHVYPYLVAWRIFVLEEKRMTCLYNQVWRQRLAQVGISRIKRNILVVVRYTRLKLQPFRGFKHLLQAPVRPMMLRAVLSRVVYAADSLLCTFLVKVLALATTLAKYHI